MEREEINFRHQPFGDYKFSEANTIVKSVGDIEKPADQSRADPKVIPTAFHTSIGFASKGYSHDQIRIGFDIACENPGHKILE